MCGASQKRKEKQLLWASKEYVPALLALVVVAFYSPIVFLGRAFYLKDAERVVYPTRLFLRQRLLAFDLPEWLPALDMGMPFLANPSNGVLYPLNVLLLLPAPYCVSVFIVSHAVVAVLGAFALLRALHVRPAPSAVGAVAFALGGYMVSLTWVPNYMMSLAWLPLVACLALRSQKSGRFSDAALAGLVWAVQILSGEPQGVVLTGWFVVALAIGFPRRSGPKWKRWLLLLVAASIACCVALPQILPALELIPRSRRAAGIALAEASHWSLHPLRLLELFASNLFGSPIRFEEFLGYFMDDEGSALHRDPWIVSPYGGSIIVLFALVSLATARRAHRYWVRSLGVLFAVSLLLALGRHLPFFGLYFRFIPGAQLFRYPAKIFGLSAAILPLLGAAGFDAWRRQPRMRLPVFLTLTILAALTGGIGFAPWAGRALHELRPSISASAASHTVIRSLLTELAMLAAALLCLVSARQERARTAFGVLLVLSMGQVVFANFAAYATVPARVYSEPPLAKSIRSATPGANYTRVMSDVPTLSIANLDFAPGEVQAQAFANALMKNVGIANGIEYADSYISSEEGPKYEFWRTTGLLRRQMLDLFGIRHLILPSSVPVASESGLRRLDAPSAKGVAVYENPNALPFAFAVTALKFVENQSAAMFAIRDANVARGLYAVADLAAGDAPGTVPSATLQPRRAGQCHLVRPLADHFELDCELTEPGYVVINESFHPQFTARIDGAPTAILRANAFVMALQAKAGKHRLALEYSEQSLAPALAASVCGVLVAILLVYRRSRERPHASGSRNS
jgi:hypothetical protein